MPLTDFYVQRKIKDGDIREFERLFEKYYVPLCKYANTVVNDMDSAEDIVQDFFYHFWKNRATFNPKLSLNSYLYHSIRNNSVHYMQHLAIRKSYAEQVLGNLSEIIASDSHDAIEMRELLNAVKATIQLLPVRCARVFCMNRFEGKKYREIAEALSISVKTVEADMGKALQQFRKSLKEFASNDTRITS